MALLTAADIAELKSVWESALFDTCVLQTRVPNADSRLKPSYTNGTPVACLFEPLIANEAPGVQAPDTDGHVIFGKSTAINNLMRVKITYLNGVALAQVYEIIGGPITHHLGQKVRVKLVTNGTAT